MEPFLIGEPIRSGAAFITGKHKILTWSFFHKIDVANVPVFNIMIDENVIYNAIELYCKKKSSQKDLKDVLLVLNNESISQDLKKYLLNKKYNMSIIDNINAERADLSKRIKNNKIKVLILFTGLDNTFINITDKNVINKLLICEVFTFYGSNNDSIKDRLVLDKKAIIENALQSKEFNKFSTIKEGSAVVNYKVKTPNSVKIIPNKMEIYVK